MGWYGTDEQWQRAEPLYGTDELCRHRHGIQATSQPSSAAEPACAASRLSEEPRGRKFLAAFEAAAYEREDNPAQAAFLRELVHSLFSGRLLLAPTADVWQLEEEQREDLAMAKLDQLMKLVVRIRTAWTLLPRASTRAKSRGAAWGRSKDICPKARCGAPPRTCTSR